MEKKPIKLV
jgi:hypothetical protein